MAKKYLKKYLLSLAISKVKINKAMMANAGSVVGKGEASFTGDRTANWHSHSAVQRILKKLKEFSKRSSAQLYN